MDPVVTARVPEGVRDRGIEVLKSIGSTTSELINAAFDYVIQAKELPRFERATSGEVRVLSKEQAEDLSEFMRFVKVDVPAVWDDANFEDLFDDAMGQRYAGLH